MSGLDFNPTTGRLTITNGSRTVATTDGTLVCLLPTVQEFTKTLTFPDFEKDEAYFWTWGVATNPLGSDEYAKGEYCACMITAIPQEYSNKTVLMAAPAGADFFVGQVRINRTNAPNNTWMERTLNVLPIEDEWIPWSGSCLMEAEVGMARAMHIYIDSANNLVLEAEQSVSVPAKGYQAFGRGVSSVNLFGGGGGEILKRTTAGLAVFLRSSKSYGYTAFAASSSTPVLYRRSGSSPCARDDTTNYLSAYRIEIQGRFGRRS